MIDLAARLLPGALADRRRAGLAAPPRRLVEAGAPGRTLHLEVEGNGGGHWYIALDSPAAVGTAGPRRSRISPWTAPSSASWPRAMCPPRRPPRASTANARRSATSCSRRRRCRGSRRSPLRGGRTHPVGGPSAPWGHNVLGGEVFRGGGKARSDGSRARRKAPSGGKARSGGSRAQAERPAQAKTTVRRPLSSTRRSLCHFTARASAWHSTSRPIATSWSGRDLVADPLDLLLDDRALVEVGRHIVRGGTDQLHAAGVRLVVRLGALEARQEGVVDVDDPAATAPCTDRRRAPACSGRARPARRSPPRTSSSSCASASALLSLVTGMWWKGMSYEPTSSAKSVWLETTAAISTGSAPIRERKSRSFRQCPNLLTIRTIRILSSARWICQSMLEGVADRREAGPQLLHASPAPPPRSGPA